MLKYPTTTSILDPQAALVLPPLLIPQLLAPPSTPETMPGVMPASASTSPQAGIPQIQTIMDQKPSTLAALLLDYTMVTALLTTSLPTLLPKAILRTISISSRASLTNTKSTTYSDCTLVAKIELKPHQPAMKMTSATGAVDITSTMLLQDSSRTSFTKPLRTMEPLSLKTWPHHWTTATTPLTPLSPSSIAGQQRPAWSQNPAIPQPIRCH